MERVNAFTFDQTISINGICGYVDFIGEDVTILVDRKGKSHLIGNKDILEVYSYQKIHSNDLSIYYVNNN